MLVKNHWPGGQARFAINAVPDIGASMVGDVNLQPMTQLGWEAQVGRLTTIIEAVPAARGQAG